MRQGSAVYYLHGDHLGSASLTTDASGNPTSQLRYLPYSAPRPGYPTGNVPTDYRFTGQRSKEASLGSLYDYGARMFSPYPSCIGEGRMYYTDLTPYRYLPMIPRDPNQLNVGWLGRGHPYSQGKVSEEFLDRLFEFCRAHLFKMGGNHGCELCVHPSDGMRVQRGDRQTWLGDAEIRVVGKGKVYAAPTLIFHYVTAHKYRPPDEFIQAVLEGPLPGSPEYEAIVEKYKVVVTACVLIAPGGGCDGPA